MNRIHFKDNVSSHQGSHDADHKCFHAINRFNLSIAILITVISSQAFANRPSVDESSTVTDEPETTTSQMPTQSSPSSVEIMMQQQSHQSGDVIQLPATELQPGEVVPIKLLDYPRRGMTMQKVQNEYGQPITISDSVGKPPITRWTYQDRVVYFEYSNVIHVVAR